MDALFEGPLLPLSMYRSTGAGGFLMVFPRIEVHLANGQTVERVNMKSFEMAKVSDRAPVGSLGSKKSTGPVAKDELIWSVGCIPAACGRRR